MCSAVADPPVSLSRATEAVCVGVENPACIAAADLECVAEVGCQTDSHDCEWFRLGDDSWMFANKQRYDSLVCELAHLKCLKSFSK